MLSNKKNKDDSPKIAVAATGLGASEELNLPFMIIIDSEKITFHLLVTCIKLILLICLSLFAQFNLYSSHLKYNAPYRLSQLNRT